MPNCPFTHRFGLTYLLDYSEQARRWAKLECWKGICLIKIQNRVDNQLIENLPSKLIRYIVDTPNPGSSLVTNSLKMCAKREIVTCYWGLV